jgi:ectoine hydroxylase-related dioxygenase (phytanoyl-CoA dioxygenase family)
MPIDFAPADPHQSKTLSSSHVAQFNEVGFISPLDALTADEANASRVYFEHLLEKIRAMKDRRNAYSIMMYHNRCKGIYDLALHPVILAYVEDLLGPDFLMWSSHYFCKEPGDPKRVPWHQDATYWPVRPTRTVTVWLAVDDVTPENAPIRFLPRSHRLGKVAWEPAEGETALGQEIKDISPYGVPYDNVMRAGQISIHASTLIHGSEPNLSGQRRCGLTLRYIPSWCGVNPGAERILDDAVTCRGDPGQWRVNARPSGDDVTRIHDAYRD